MAKEYIKIDTGTDVKKFSVIDHNEMIETIDSVIVKIQSFKNGESNLELDNAIKSLLEASTRINNHYTKVNNPTTKTDEKTA